MADTIVVPENAAHGCPGANTESAGKTSACEGCPNKGICSEGKTVDTGKDAVIERLKSVKRKLLILSGKGGVGKSTITMLLAKYLSDKFKSLNFGVLDLDICGPSQPRMMGVENEQVHSSGSGWSPVNIDDNLCLMSIGFLLSSPDDAIIWRGPKKNNMIRQFLSNVDWGKLDLLLLDTPPGTSDEHMSSFSYLNTDSGDTGVLIVTTPHEIALLDVRKQISFCRKFNIPVVGVIENMSLFHCGKCGNTSNIFSTGAGAVKDMCEEFDLKFLGSLPIDTRLAELCDKGFDEFALSEVTIKSLDVMSVEVEKFWT